MQRRCGGLGFIIGGIISGAIVLGLAVVGLKYALPKKISAWLEKWVVQPFANFIQQISNYFKGAGFKTDKEVFNDYKKTFHEALFAQHDTLKSVEEEIMETFKEIKNVKRSEKLTPEQDLKETKERLQNLADSLNQNEEVLMKSRDLYLRYRDRLLRKYDEKMLAKLETVATDENPAKADPEIQKLQEFQRSYKENLEKYMKIQKAYLESSKKLADLEPQVKEALRKFRFDSSKLSFENFTWYDDILNQIKESLNKQTSKAKIKLLEYRIKKWKETFDKLSLTPEEARTQFKELSNLQMQKFSAEMEGLQKEREYIESTNELIKEYVDKAMEWKAQGVEGIRADTAEGYKFMTSGLSDISALAPIMKDSQSKQAELQIKANEIANKTKNSIDFIKKKMEGLPMNTEPITINVYN